MKKVIISSVFILSLSVGQIFAQTPASEGSWNVEGLSWSVVFTWKDSIAIEDIEAQEHAHNDMETEDETLSPRARSIEDFNDRKMNIISNIYENTSFKMMLDVDDAKSQLRDLSAEFKDIVTNFNQVKDKKSKVDERYNEIRESMEWIIADIDTTKAALDERLIKIHLYTNKMVELEQLIAQTKKDIDQSKSDLMTYTNFLYKINNDYYWKDLSIDDIKLLIKSDSIAWSLSTEDIVKSLTVELDQLLKTMSENQKKYEDYMQKINEIRTQYKYEVQGYQNDINNLTQQKKYLWQLFIYLKKDKKEVDNEFDFLFDNKDNLKKQIFNVMLLSKQQTPEAQFGTGIDISQLLQSTERSDSDKFFSWPVNPPFRFTAGFDDDWYKEQIGVKHNAIDLAKPMWSEIYAPANWIVYKVVDQDGPGLNWMIVMHKHGYVTVYLHLNKILVKEWDYVQRWDIIWLLWWKPWTRWAWLATTGPHLHFEVIKNGQIIDPLTVLDLGVFPSKSSLPQTYQIKYFKDKIWRTIDLSDVTYAKWKTIEERRQSYLKTASRGAYADVALWQEAVKGYNVDIDLWICIWTAETWLGKAYAKNGTHNVWNVWNNDRGDRQAFSSPVDGARSIYATLSNKYLSIHNSIDKLSRYGSPEWSIYASSDLNWQKNVIRCMSSIKGYWVQDDYFFRTYLTN